MIELFSTTQARSESGIEFWNQLLGDTFQGLVVDPVDTRFHAELQRWSLDGMALTWPRSTGARIARSRATHRNDRLVLHILQSGVCQASHRGGQTEMAPGDMVIFSAEEAYVFDAPKDHQMLVAEFDRSLLTTKMVDVDAHIARVISGQHASTRILRNFLLSVWREGGSNLDTASAEPYADMIVGLAAVALQAPSSACDQRSDPVLSRIRGIVEARLSEPGLSPSGIAEQIGVPLRTVQLATAKAGTTLSAYILRRRLERASELLVSAPGLSVTQLALDLGFNDCSYFSRRFHAAFGASPSEYRTSH